MVNIHPAAIVEAGAALGEDVEIGPYAYIGPHVEIGSGTHVGAHAVIAGHTRIGVGNRIFSQVALGGPPQDMKYAGEATRLEIGDYNTIREFCTCNTGTVQDKGVTTLGSHNWIMAYVHIAHDCVVGDHVVMANATTLAGHVEIGDWTVLGGMTGVHQFCKVGPHVITAGGSIVLKDIPPYVMAAGNPAHANGINSEGLRRRGLPAGAIERVRRAYKTLYREGLTLAEAMQRLEADAAQSPEVALLLDFLRRVERGIVR